MEFIAVVSQVSRASMMAIKYEVRAEDIVRRQEITFVTNEVLLPGDKIKVTWEKLDEEDQS